MDAANGRDRLAVAPGATLDDEAAVPRRCSSRPPSALSALPAEMRCSASVHGTWSTSHVLGRHGCEILPGRFRSRVAAREKIAFSACSGNVELTLPQGKITLAAGDAAILTRAGDAPFRIAPAARSRGLRISSRPRLSVPTQHQAVIFESNRGEGIQTKPLSQARACRGEGEGQERRLQSGNDLAGAT